MPAESLSHPRQQAIVLSAEHSGNAIPPELRQRIVVPPKVLASHRGYDRGSCEISLALGDQLGITPILATYSRLVVDLNRSESVAGVFSRYGQRLDNLERERIFQQHYRPFRAAVRAAIEQHLAAGHNVIHVSVHTFTPVLRGDRRSADIGLLFDPQRAAESRLATRWRDTLLTLAPRLAVKFNYPYLGVDDGHTTSLRAIFSGSCYAGIELEVNQAWARAGGRRFTTLLTTLSKSLECCFRSRETLFESNNSSVNAKASESAKVEDS